MARPLERIEAELRAVPREDRAHLLDVLISSLDDTDAAEIGPEWLEEIRRRSEQIRRGEVDPIDNDEVFARVRARRRRAESLSNEDEVRPA